MCVHIDADTHGSYKRALDSLGLEEQAVVSCLMCAGNQIWYSARAIHSLHN